MKRAFSRVISRKATSKSTAAIALSLFFLCAAALPAQHSLAIHQQIKNVATALSVRNPVEAMSSIDRKFADYSQLEKYFTSLTSGYTVINELDIADEVIANGQATVTVHWTLTLGDLATGLTENRDEELTFKLTLKKTDWRIVSISPIEFFNPDYHKSK